MSNQKFGYARVSTKDQKLDLQIIALKKFGCDTIFTEKISGYKERPHLQEMINKLREGDTIVVWKLDRLGRSIRHIVELIDHFKKIGVNFISLNDNINTTTSQGRFFINIIASLAEYERELIIERTKAGQEAARLRGKFIGKPKGLSKDAYKKAQIAKELYEDKKMKAEDIAIIIGKSRATVYRYLNNMDVNYKNNPL
ncbi:recombinase family protein [Labilibaculum sp. DW002]|uniref:Recombinase family protein n=1 Tax=Paralabilibaculum antarcticum TaxID=2912572 RepID=A0ABT5VQE3_9BACT|nr:recombinase family protein [Labilibaculum sp. DW002]MDE5417638.1 recombinase family protein [Labilibaculum sp. DW002]